MNYYAKVIEDLINEIISKIDFSRVISIGFPMSYYQWIPAGILAKEIKNKFPLIPIVIGGIGNKNTAIAFLDNFYQFDYAIWGEGESPLKKLNFFLKNKTKDYKYLNQIENLVYRKNGKLSVSSSKNHFFPELSQIEMRPDYTDYFNQNEISNKDKESWILLPIEGSRGCHWNKCHFCFLNIGYKHRLKSPDIILKEIRFMINKYNVYQFEFLDNDIISNNLDRFDYLLDNLIDLKNEFPQFNIIGAEIITKDLHANHIRKMSLAGFKLIQIGYESPSDKLLKK